VRRFRLGRPRVREQPASVQFQRVFHDVGVQFIRVSPEAARGRRWLIAPMGESPGPGAECSP
jgi:hypothetical protein